MNVEIKPIPFSTEGPQPLLRPIANGEAYPVAALGPLEAAVRAVQDKTQAPPLPLPRNRPCLSPLWPCKALPMWKPWAAPRQPRYFA